MQEKIISANEVCKSFAANGIQNHVLNGITFDIFDGEFTVIMGASGSGKSTLLYALSGMDQVTSGQILFRDQVITDMNEKQMCALRRQAFGFIFQQIHLVSNMSLLENVTVSGYLSKKTTSAEVKQDAVRLLESMNLGTAGKRLPAQVSGGEQQRAAIARAIIHQPDVLFADEPTGALNRKNTSDVLDLLSKLHEDGQNIVMVTHDIKAALRADRILYLSDGRIISELRLAPYGSDDFKSRETQVNAWLGSMEW